MQQMLLFYVQRVHLAGTGVFAFIAAGSTK